MGPSGSVGERVRVRVRVSECGECQGLHGRYILLVMLWCKGQVDESTQSEDNYER